MPIEGLKIDAPIDAGKIRADGSTSAGPIEGGQVEIGQPASPRRGPDLRSMLGAGDNEFTGSFEVKHDVPLPDLDEDDNVEPNSSAVEQLREEIRELKSERGRYGREVVGPLRAENEMLKERLDAMEARLNGSGGQASSPSGDTPTSTDPEQVAKILFGKDADMSDPEVSRLSSAIAMTLDATERGTRQYVGELEQKIAQLQGMLEGTQELAAAGLSRDQVRQLEQDYPELKELPDSARYRLIRKLLSKASPGGTPPRDPRSGKFLPRGESHDHWVDPDQMVEGSGGVFDSSQGEDDLWQRRLKKFKNLSNIGKPRDQWGPGAEGMKNLFVSMMESGAFKR